MKNFAIIIMCDKKKTAGAVLTKVNEYKQSLGISHPMILGATIEAAIYIVVVSLCLSDCTRAVVEETQVDSILD